MMFGMQCQLRSARGVNEAMTSQWSNLRSPFNNDAFVNSFSVFQATRNNGQWQPGNTAHTCTDHNGNNVRRKLEFFTEIL